ncbi:MAG: DUF1573 domain-containing protein [Candidatus Nitrospinota bacterium M3_3B_026]
MRIAIAIATALIALTLPGPAVAGPSMDITPRESNTGTVDEGESAARDFTIKNTGDAPLEIKRVKTSCGCTASGLEKNRLAPGETALLRVEYDTAGRPGKFRKKVTVFGDDPENERVHVYISGFVKRAPGPRISVEPSVLRVGEIPPGGPIPVKFTIENTGEKALTVSRVTRISLNEENRPADRAVVLDKPFTLAPGGRRFLEFHAPAPGGGNFRIVYSIMSNDPHFPTSYLRVLGGAIDEETKETLSGSRR